jgi:hypothetical protein
MRIERGDWQLMRAANCAGQSSGELSTTGTEELPVGVTPAVFVACVALPAGVDVPALLPPCEQAASSRHITKKKKIRRTGCMYVSRLSIKVWLAQLFIIL